MCVDVRFNLCKGVQCKVLSNSDWNIAFELSVVGGYSIDGLRVFMNNEPISKTSETGGLYLYNAYITEDVVFDVHSYNAGYYQNGTLIPVDPNPVHPTTNDHGNGGSDISLIIILVIIILTILSVILLAVIIRQHNRYEESE